MEWWCLLGSTHGAMSLCVQRAGPRASGPLGGGVVAGVPWAGELQSLLLREPDGGWMGPESTPGFMGASLEGPREVPSLGWAP